ncbi:MAG: nucleotide sugar dehydrogenase [Myxococcales bacterium]|nr:nucleotide sugar dehydrogenase [Myxococcales bacterium]
MGLGRVGLPTAVLFGRAGLDVVGVDVSDAVRARIECREVGSEPGLRNALSVVLHGGLRVAARPVAARAYLISVPTPLHANRQADLSQLQHAVATVASVAPRGALVAIQSTVPVGTTDEVAATLRARDPTLRVAHCPERVLPGDALREMVHNDRLVGGVDEDSTAAAVALWRSVAEGELLSCDARTAELTKLVENASRDVQLALANSVAHLAEQHGLDPARVRELANRHPRVSLLHPGPGVGGHCIPVDPWFLMTQGVQGTELFRAAREVNTAVVHRVERRIREEAGAGRAIAILGLAYKPDVDDERNAPALQLARRLSVDLDVVVTDPFVRVPPDLREVSLDEAMTRDLVVLAVAHEVYRAHGPPSGRDWMDLCGGWP